MSSRSKRVLDGALCVSAALLYASSSVAANTSLSNARVLVPDGTSVFQPIGPGETRWFVFGVEAGRAYVVEAVDSDGDSSTSALGSMSLFDITGIHLMPDMASDCTPSLSALPPVLLNGSRCVLYVLPPDISTTNLKAVYVRIDQGSSAGFNVRVRDTTMFGRWTTNGYEFHIEFDNTTTASVCAQALLYRESGYTFVVGGWGDASLPGNLRRYNVTIPPNGSAKIVVPAGTQVGASSRGTLRILPCGAVGTQFLPGSVHISAYAFNPVSNVYLFLNTWPSHNGSGANSW
jgi:hypothetical protein